MNASNVQMWERIGWISPARELPPMVDDEAGDEDGDVCYVMTQDAAGQVRAYCYLEAGVDGDAPVWRFDDDGTDEEIEEEVVLWTHWPVGDLTLQPKVKLSNGNVVEGLKGGRW
jgi:hypothetical protein